MIKVSGFWLDIPCNIFTQDLTNYLLTEDLISGQSNENVKGNYSYQIYNSEAIDVSCACLGDTKKITFEKFPLWEKDDDTEIGNCRAFAMLVGD